MLGLCRLALVIVLPIEAQVFCQLYKVSLLYFLTSLYKLEAIHFLDLLLVVLCPMVIRCASPGDYPCEFQCTSVRYEMGDCQVESHQSLDGA